MDFVGVRNEIQNLAERGAIGIPVQAHTGHVLLHNIHRTQDEILEVREELRLFHDNMCRLYELAGFHNTHKGVSREGRIGVAIVTYNRVIFVPGIKTACYTKSLDADDGIATKDGENRRRLSGEHGADIEFEGHFGGCEGGRGAFTINFIPVCHLS